MGGRNDDGVRINHRIRAREVRVIGPDGAQLGVMEVRKALELAQYHGLDLAEISPNSKPPVCKILDYGKFKYEAKKKAQAAKKNQVVTTLKEIQFRPQTDEHDVEFKVKHIIRFLAEGNKVKVSIRFRGREAVHADLGHALLKQIVDKVGQSGMVETPPKMEGKILSMIFAPSGKVAKKQGKPEGKPEGKQAAGTESASKDASKKPGESSPKEPSTSGSRPGQGSAPSSP
jgi:translation initiation factor IF-3